MSASLLETVLAHGELPFLHLFFRCWRLPEIFLLGRLSFRLRCIVYYYCSKVWSVPHFLGRWFPSPDAALRLLGTAPAIVCGASVMQFFDRAYMEETRLDICVDFGGLLEVGQFLLSQGYQFKPGPSAPIKDFELAALVEVSHFSAQRRMTADRSFSQQHHDSRILKFSRTLIFDDSGVSRTLIVLVHLVRCELHRFVFAMHSTALMNYIDGEHAVSVFARSAFVVRRSFIACQEAVPGSDAAMTEYSEWLSQYHDRYAPMEIIGTSAQVYPEAECGRRWIGDTRCWIIPCRYDR
ncbi:hypothetical protein B0H16DRAFT_1733628 [Mycena metata]|uniref:Uncharacterized protein n=1 Tax=Mycena metata TaxID=1033252 RepID=A0AAD7MT18_9AGAR|nr:hypothetical protein B0H16DRAFT_1733628 [Mycena metata]